MTRRREPKRPPRLTMASNSFRDVEIEAMLDLLSKAELAVETKVIARNEHVQAMKVKLLKMRDRIAQTRARQAFHVALEEAARRPAVVAEPVRPSARAGRP
jgi:hypothetical protein